jgi:hypothetical protein
MTIKKQLQILKSVTGEAPRMDKAIAERRKATWLAWYKDKASGQEFNLSHLPTIARQYCDEWEAKIPENDDRSVGQSETKDYGNKEQGQKVSFELNPDGRTTDGKKSQAMSTTRKRSPVIGRSYADVARKATRKVAVVSKSVQRMLLTL